MPRRTTGSVYRTADGYGIRWPEDGRRPHKAGFKTKTEARDWFAEHVAPRLRAGGPSPDVDFDRFCDVFLERHGGTVSPRTRETLRERLAPARQAFGGFTLRELEGAAADIARWRAGLPDTSRYRLTSALRQALGAAVRWGYLRTNPAVDAGRNPQPRKEELFPFSRDEIDALDAELGPVNGPLVVFAAETGLRTNEWAALERRDIDLTGPAVGVQRRVSDGRVTPYPKTARSRRRVPFTARALGALDRLPPRIDTPLLFPAPRGTYIGLDTWRTRVWYPALEAAKVRRRGPYHLRHTFATEALAAGVPLWELARFMGASAKTIDDVYGHLARDSEDAFRARLEARAGRSGSFWRRSPSEPARPRADKRPIRRGFAVMGRAGLEPATSGLSSRRSPC
jgi:integrase/recombinase XerD